MGREGGARVRGDAHGVTVDSRGSLALAEEPSERPSQRARRERILAAALELASEGGYDAVQMREVAERADVALGTLYRYFPSKVHLLVSAMALQLEALRDEARPRSMRGDPADRVYRVIARLTRFIEQNRQLSAALIRGVMSADATVTDEVRQVSGIMTSVISAAWHASDAPPTAHDAVVAGIIGKVWLADILSWLGDRMTISEVLDDLARTIAVVMPSDEGAS